MVNSYKIVNRCLIIGLKGELDQHLADKIRLETEKYFERYMIKYIIFNFENVAFMDSSGIGMIMGRYRQVNRIGGKVFVVNVNNSMNRILEMSGLLKIVEKREKLEDIMDLLD